jgi:acyl carrier protein
MPLSSSTAQARLYQTMAATFGVAPDALDDSTSAEHIATWDSLNHLNLVMALEQEFALSLSVEDAIEMRTVGRIRAVLARHGVEC